MQISTPYTHNTSYQSDFKGSEEEQLERIDSFYITVDF